MKFYKYSTGDSVMRHKTIDKSPSKVKRLDLLIKYSHSVFMSKM